MNVIKQVDSNFNSSRLSLWEATYSCIKLQFIDFEKFNSAVGALLHRLWFLCFFFLVSYFRIHWDTHNRDANANANSPTRRVAKKSLGVPVDTDRLSEKKIVGKSRLIVGRWFLQLHFFFKFKMMSTITVW